MKKIVSCEFKKGGKSYFFDTNNLELEISDNVILQTERGLQYATVTTEMKEENEKFLNYELQKIIRKADTDDERKNQKNLKDAENAMKKADELAKSLGLEMKFTDASYTFDRNQLIFYYISDNRVDFRELARELAGIYKTRIELRQIGVRDKAKLIGGIGPCGLFLCCNSFLSDFNSVSINMAKNQFLALNPSKINGVCGRLLCCLNYEDDIYTDLKKSMPKIGEILTTKSGKGKVVSVDIFKRKYELEIDKNNKIEVNVE